MRLTAKDFGLQEENMKTSTSPNCRERQLIMITGWGTPERETETDRQTDRQTDGQKGRERGREDAVLYGKKIG